MIKLVKVLTGFGKDFYNITDGTFTSKQDKKIRGVSIRKIKVDEEGVQTQKSTYWINLEAVNDIAKAIKKVAEKIKDGE